MPRLPLLAGSSLAAVHVSEETVLLAAPPPLDPITNVADAVAEALRFPLSGPPLGALARRGGRATIVVDPPTLPLPGAASDPRRDALAAVIDELARLDVRPERQTVLVAGGLERRAGRRELEALLRPSRAREFHGSVVVHDCEEPVLRPLGEAGGVALRAHPLLVDTDVVAVVSAAETVLHGGPAALLDACGPETRRAAAAESLLEPGSSRGWRLATAVEAAVAARVALVGVSLVLDHPRPAGRYRGWPSDARTRTQLARSLLRRLHNAMPASLRQRMLQSLRREIRAVGALAGAPSVAHAEALMRGVAVRSVPLEQLLDVIVVPLPWKSAHHPRETLDPITAAHVGLGHALRLWRECPPLAPGGAVVLLHGFRPTFGGASGAPHRRLYLALRGGGPDAVADAEEAAARDQHAIDAYRAGRAPHPLLPYADWAACEPARRRAGCVIVGGCRDAGAARALGFVPSHSPQAALEMAVGVAGGGRMGVLLAPPYPPLVVG